MDVPTKPSTKPAARSGRDTFLADAVRPRPRHMTYGDGFRFGIGLIAANLLVGLIFGGLAWIIAASFNLHL